MEPLIILLLGGVAAVVLVGAWILYDAKKTKTISK